MTLAKTGPWDSEEWNDETSEMKLGSGRSLLPIHQREKSEDLSSHDRMRIELEQAYDVPVQLILATRLTIN